MTKLAFLDCETTGLDPHVHVPWEIAYILREDDQPDREVVLRIKPLPGNLEDADPKALEICRFEERTSMPDIPWNTLGYANWLLHEDLAGAHLVGNVVSFDAEMIGRQILANAFPRPWHYHLIDVEALAVGALAARGHSLSLPWDSEEISRLLGVTPASGEDRHTALGDARWARDLYDAIHTITSA